jgi:hypothetical protein
VCKPCKRLYCSKCFLPSSRPLPRHCALTKDMRWASNILWFIARQSSILSMPTGEFVRASSSSLFSLILLMRCQKSENWAAASRRKGITSWKFFQGLISVQLKCIWRENTHFEYPKSASDQRWQQLFFWIKKVDMQCSRNPCLESKVIGNLNFIDFIFQVLRCQGVDRGKSMYFKAVDICLVNIT